MAIVIYFTIPSTRNVIFSDGHFIDLPLCNSMQKMEFDETT